MGRENKRRGARSQTTADRELTLVWFWLGSSRSRRYCGCSSDEESSAAWPPSTNPLPLPASTSHSAAPVSSTLPSSPPCQCDPWLVFRRRLAEAAENGGIFTDPSDGGLSSATTAHSPPLVNHCGCDRKDGGRRHKSQRGEAARPCALVANHSGY